MHTKWLPAWFVVLVVGCGGPGRNVAQPPVESALSGGVAAVAPRPPVHCRDLAGTTVFALTAFAQRSLWEIWEELARVEGVPPFFAVDAALLPHGMPPNLSGAPVLCAGPKNGAGSLAILFVPGLQEMRRRPGLSPADALSSIEDQDLERARGSRLVTVSDDGRVERPHIVPLGRGSLIHLAGPRMQTHGPVVFGVPDERLPPVFGVTPTVPQDIFDYRFRLPEGTARILLLSF